ncbi:MAG TPA: hypothetical protein EYG92_01510 [Lutibacter sp.]|nr:hypothetical protein [Lutibacter sp.]
MIGSGSYGCVEENINVTLDDEASSPVIDECPAYGNYSPENMLSAFDGESLLGDWSLTIEDTFPTQVIKLQKAIIYTIEGKIIESIDLTYAKCPLSIDVSNYTKGVYLVSIIAEDQSKMIKRLLIE